MKAIWQNTVLAESEKTIVMEGNHYFPPNSVNYEYLSPSETHTTCHWKGTASYYNVTIGNETNVDAAWHYPEPKAAARSIKGFVAFWRGVSVTA